MLSLITKQNKNHWIGNYKRYFHHFYKAQYDLRLELFFFYSLFYVVIKKTYNSLLMVFTENEMVFTEIC